MAEEVSKEKKHKVNEKKKKAEKNKAMTMYEKLQLAEQGRNAVAKELGLIKEESPAQPLFDGHVPSTDLPSKATSSSTGRKAGRSFLDEFRSDLHAIIIDGDDDEDEKVSKKQKLNIEEKKLELQERELSLREAELQENRDARRAQMDENRDARREQMEMMLSIINKLAK